MASTYHTIYRAVRPRWRRWLDRFTLDYASICRLIFPIKGVTLVISDDHIQSATQFVSRYLSDVGAIQPTCIYTSLEKGVLEGEKFPRRRLSYPALYLGADPLFQFIFCTEWGGRKVGIWRV